MKKRDIALAIFFIAVFAALLIYSSAKTQGQTEQISEADIETVAVSAAPAPRGEAKQEITESVAVLAENAESLAQTVSSIEPEEVAAEATENDETRSETFEEEITPEPTAEPTEEPTPEPTPEPEEEYVAEEEESSMVYLGTFTVTAYCSCSACAGQWAGSPTASGAYPCEGWTCACNAYPFGTMVYIEGVGERCIEDRGDSGMDETWIDLYFEDHDAAQNFGMQYLDVYIVG